MIPSKRIFPSAVCWLLTIAVLAAVRVSGQQANHEQVNHDANLPEVTGDLGRISVHVPKQALHIGEKNAFNIELKGPPLRGLIVSQSQPDARGQFIAMRDEEGQELAVEHRADGGAFVNVVPMGLGTIRFSFIAAFTDDAMDIINVTAQVVAARPARQLELQQSLPRGPDRSTLWMSVGRHQVLWLRADFDGVRWPLEVAAKDVQFKLRQTGSDPVIRFDPSTGAIDTLRLGDALIDSTYEGAKQTICVMVRESNGSPPGDCAELQAGGNGLLPTAPDTDTPGAAWGSYLPYTATDVRQGRFVADDRVEIVDPGHPLYIAEENPITFKVHSGTVVRVECGGGAWCVPRDRHGDRARQFTFEAQPNGDVVAQLFLAYETRQIYEFAVFFADGGVAHKTFQAAAVVYGTKQPTAINRSCGNDSYGNPNLPIRLGAPDAGVPTTPTDNLWSSACYEGLGGFFVGIPPELMTFRVWSDGDEPAIKVDAATGQVTPLRPGQALLEREFRGLKSETCVVVETGSEWQIEDLSNCRALRAKYGAPLPELPPLGTSGPDALSPVSYDRAEQQIERARLSPHLRDRFEADERLQISLDGVSLPLGEPGTLNLRLAGPEVLKAAVAQNLTGFIGPQQQAEQYEDQVVNEERKIGTIETRPDGSTYMNLIPRRIERAEFRIDILFADGGVATRTFQVSVKLPENPPFRLTYASDGSPIGSGYQATTIHLMSTAPHNMRRVFPVVWYGENLPSVRLDASDVKFNVLQAAGPVIRLNEATGEITALRVGHALIETSFSGAKSETCVVVMANLTIGDASNCEELRGQN